MLQLAMAYVYLRILKHSFHIIQTRIFFLVKHCWLVVFLKPLIRQYIRDCSSLHECKSLKTSIKSLKENKNNSEAKIKLQNYC